MPEFSPKMIDPAKRTDWEIQGEAKYPSGQYVGKGILKIKVAAAAAAAKSLQSCPTLCDPVDGCPPGSPVPGSLQARTLEWVAISFSNAWKGKVKVKSLSPVRLLVTPWTAAYQAPSMGFSRQEYWSGCHCLLWDEGSRSSKLTHLRLSPEFPKPT